MICYTVLMHCFIQLSITISTFLLGARATFADIDAPSRPAIGLENPLEEGGIHSISDLLQKVIEYLTTIAGPILVIMVICGAFSILTAGGNEQKITTGKKTITYAVIGFAIILIGWGFTYVIEEFLGVSPSQ